MREEHAEVGLVDAKLLLHAAGGQPDLPADQPPAVVELPACVDLLHRVGVFAIEVRVGLAQRRNRLPAARGLQQRVGRGLMGLRVHACGSSFRHTLDSSV